jgi:hypothetical protein
MLKVYVNKDIKDMYPALVEDGDIKYWLYPDKCHRTTHAPSTPVSELTYVCDWVDLLSAIKSAGAKNG